MRNIFFRSLCTVILLSCCPGTFAIADDTLESGVSGMESSPASDTIAGTSQEQPGVSSAASESPKSSSYTEELCRQESNTVGILRGKRSKAAIKPVLDSIRQGMDWFYRKRQKEHAEYCGSVCLYITIEPDGRVSSVNAVVPSEDEQLTQEVEKRFGAIKFRRCSESEPTEVFYALNFDRRRQRGGGMSGEEACGRAILATIPLLVSIFLIPRLFHP